MTTHSTFLKFESGDQIQIESRAFDGPYLHIGHDGDTFSRIRLTGTETIGLISELIASLSNGMHLRDVVEFDPVLTARGCICTITERERIEDRTCPVHFPFREGLARPNPITASASTPDACICQYHFVNGSRVRGLTHNRCPVHVQPRVADRCPHGLANCMTCGVVPPETYDTAMRVFGE